MLRRCGGGTVVVTQAAPIMLPVGMILYGTGSKQEKDFDADAETAMNSQMGFPCSALPAKPPKAMPAPKGAGGNLSMYRCSCCHEYKAKAEFGLGAPAPASPPRALSGPLI